MITDEVDEVTEELFTSLKNRNQNNLESMKGSDYVHLLYYKCHEINPNRGGSYVNSPDSTKKKKSNNKPYQQKG